MQNHKKRIAFLGLILLISGIGFSQKNNCLLTTIFHQYQFEDGTETDNLPYYSFLKCEEEFNIDSALNYKYDTIAQSAKIIVQREDVENNSEDSLIKQIYLLMEVNGIQLHCEPSQKPVPFDWSLYFTNYQQLDSKVLIGTNPKNEKVKTIVHINNIRKLDNVKSIEYYNCMNKEECGLRFIRADSTEIMRVYLEGAKDEGYKLLPSYIPRFLVD